MDTQTCKNCHIEKPLSEFHRRGDLWRFECKDCACAAARATYAKRGKATLPSKIKSAPKNMETIAEKLHKLDYKLREMAADFTNDVHEADDLYSYMVEEIIRRADPNEKLSMLRQRANWLIYEHAQKHRTYNHYVDEIKEVETLASPSTVEDTIIEQEVSEELKAIIDQLPAEYQQVVSLLTLGLSQREIAKRLKVTEQAVSQKIKRVGTKMLSLGFSPA